MDNLKLIEDVFFNEIIPEANNGEISIYMKDEMDPIIFNVAFDTYIEGDLNSGSYGDSHPVLMIKSKNKLLPIFQQYVDILDKNTNYFSNCDTKNRIKAYLSLLWCNAVYEDFADPYNYLKKQIDFLSNKLFDFDEKEYASNIDFTSIINSKNNKAVELVNGSDIVVKISKQDIRMETPFLFTPFIKKEEEYELPSISYGITNGECYIYGIQDKSNNRNSDYQKSINRILYSLNKGLSDDNNNLDEENVINVSPSAILSLTIFLDLLKDYEINKVKVVSLLPVRYNGKEISFEKKYQYELQKLAKEDMSLDKKEEQKKLMLYEYKKELLRIQSNLSEKLIRNFSRLEYHFSTCCIRSYPMDLDEYLHFYFSDLNNSNNNLLNAVINAKNSHLIK